MPIPKMRVTSSIRRNEAGMPTTRVDIDRQSIDAGAEAGKLVNQFPFIPGNLIRDLTFVVGTNTYIQHGLGRIPSGYFLVNIRPHPTLAAAATPGCQRNSTTDPNNDQTKFLSLGPFQPFVADVYCY